MNAAKMVSGFGQYHTNEQGKAERKDYASIDLAGIRALVDKPQTVDKSKAQWLIPSTLLSRTHKTQAESGQFWMLWADLDKDPKPFDQVAGVLEYQMLDGSDFEVYSSRSATAERPKGRILIPLSKPLCGTDWLTCQELLNDKLDDSGIAPDRASQGAGQLCYLPNRGDYYVTKSMRNNDFFDPLKAWAKDIDAKRQAIAQQSAEQALRKQEAKERRAALQVSDASSVIDAFNRSYSVQDILSQAGYDDQGDKFRHPNSESGSYSASVKDGRVHTLSAADPLYTGGHGGGAHDAFSAFTVLFHSGDKSKATKDAVDSWLKVGGDSWNRAKQREFMQEKERREAQSNMTSHHSPEQNTPSPSVAEPAAASEKPNPLNGLVSLAPISLDELTKAKLTPRCVLKDFLYADVRTRISAGGTGKTTVAMFEAVTLALGRELWGRKPEQPCKTVIVTREDSREILVARMREIMTSMLLEDDEIAQVLANVLIVDVSGVSFRLSSVADDVVVPNTPNLDWIVESLKEWKPDWIIFDPLVSFGVGESRVNDAEQGLIEAFRVLRNRLNCCIEGIHHSGKANARDKTMDQYSGRGGSALSDGCRMVTVMQPLDPQEWANSTGHGLLDGETGIVMALAKLSYSGRQEPIYIKRHGYLFSRVMPVVRNPEQENKAIVEQVMQFIDYEYSQGHLYSNKDLEDSYKTLKLSRAQLRDAVRNLKVSGRVIYIEVKGKAGSHYTPVTLADDGGDTREDLIAIEDMDI